MTDGLLPPEGGNITSQDINEYLLRGGSPIAASDRGPQNAALNADGVVLGGGWDELLRDELAKPYWSELLEFIAYEHENYEVYPPWAQTFKAFELAPYDAVKVVILGQDPYIKPGQAHGLAFSVPSGIAIPPSLRNIRKELAADLEISLSDLPDHGDLTAWAQLGVLLLNTTLTVRGGKSNSHEGMGWERFTDAVISAISADQDCTSESLGKRMQPARRLDAVHDSQQAPGRRRPGAGGLVTSGPDSASQVTRVASRTAAVSTEAPSR